MLRGAGFVRPGAALIFALHSYAIVHILLQHHEFELIRVEFAVAVERARAHPKGTVAEGVGRLALLLLLRSAVRDLLASELLLSGREAVVEVVELLRDQEVKHAHFRVLRGDAEQIKFEFANGFD